jgi:RHS repeat-associated protein
VIWGGNAIPPRIGDHVNFWGSQWDRQVTAGDYDNKADFKGRATPVASALVPCGVTGHPDGKCWSSKPGSSSPPASLERYISVIVATSIVKNGSSIDGNIAAVVVVRVDASPVYGNDPGKPAYATIVAVITDGARLFSTSTPAPPYTGYFFRHLATPRAQIASLTPIDLASLFSATTTAHLTSVLRPTPLTVAAGTKRYSFYTPEMHLLAETALTSSGAPATAYEYIWFNGHPIAQVDSGTATHWTFTDHLGTPILLTNNDASTYWRAEYEPFGAVYALRSPDVHQPLRLPGQEAEQLNLGGNGVTEREYNIHRWYRSGWGRYTQEDPIGLNGGPNLYAYASGDPIGILDPLGLKTFNWSWGQPPHRSPDPAGECRRPGQQRPNTRVSCTNFLGASLDCVCRCGGGPGWEPHVTLHVALEMYVLNGPIYPGMAHDRSIHNFDTAVQHELNKHVSKGVDAVHAWLDLWMKDSYPNKEECEGACSAAGRFDPSNMFRNAFNASAATND